jgi:triacylglycerol lipase
MQLRFILSVLLLWIFSSLAYAKDRYPIIFVHGIWINSEVYEYLLPMQKIFKKYGHQLYVARTPAGGSLEERAKILHEEINRLVPQGKFHLLGHSMGGLDSRLAIHLYDLGERCASLTTLASPHRGSYVADFVIENFGNSLAMDILEKVFASDVRAVHQLTTSHMQHDFNLLVKNDKRVKYYSMSFYIPSPVTQNSIIPWLWIAHAIQVKAGARESDGMVSVESSKWGQDLGTFPGDHYTETAPFPMGGKIMYEEVFQHVAQNLEREF